MQILTSIDINASPEAVWDTLMAFDEYPQWNPFVRELEGTAEVGARLRVKIVPPGQKGMTLKPKVLIAATAREFRWIGHLIIPGIFDGEHYFKLEPTPAGGTHFIQGEIFRGLLPPLLGKSINGPVKQGFLALNQALKERCERIQS